MRNFEHYNRMLCESLKLSNTQSPIPSITCLTRSSEVRRLLQTIVPPITPQLRNLHFNILSPSAFSHRHIRIFLQQTNASELNPLRLPILRKRLDLKIENQIRQHELQRANSEEPTGTAQKKQSAHLSSHARLPNTGKQEKELTKHASPTQNPYTAPKSAPH